MEPDAVNCTVFACLEALGLYTQSWCRPLWVVPYQSGSESQSIFWVCYRPLWHFLFLYLGHSQEAVAFLLLIQLLLISLWLCRWKLTQDSQDSCFLFSKCFMFPGSLGMHQPPVGDWNNPTCLHSSDGLRGLELTSFHATRLQWGSGGIFMRCSWMQLLNAECTSRLLVQCGSTSG